MIQLANVKYCTRVLKIINLNEITSTVKWDLPHKRKLVLQFSCSLFKFSLVKSKVSMSPFRLVQSQFSYVGAPFFMLFCQVSYLESS